MKKSKDLLLNELKIIKDNCEYTAEAHFTHAKEVKRNYLYLQLILAIITALVGGAIVVGQTIANWVGWLTAIGAVITGSISVLNPLQEYYECFIAGNAFTRLKHEARSLRDSFYLDLTNEELANAVKLLQSKYGDICSLSPLTDEKAFEKSRVKVKSGIHNPD